jgi:plasmid stabilization system protein ParE
MIPRKVVYSARAQRQVLSIFRYIANASYPRIALQYTESLRAFCDGLGSSGVIGEELHGLRPGLRRVGYRRSATIVFEVLEDTILIAGIFYRGLNARERI